MSRIVPIDVQAQAAQELTLAWQHLQFRVGDKHILKDIDGACYPGELTAIMGPSGAGKSTLMNVLAGRAPYGKLEGCVMLNGKDVVPNSYREQLAYVMQQDALFATQTPRECLEFTAALRLPKPTAEERSARVESAITALNLTRCADTLIGSAMMPGLSGGEKKRTAVAVELISSPSLIFLDEPTSGLDSHSAFELVKILRQLASKGSTIVCTIHQPSSEVFDLFHRVMFLRLGQVVYNGSVDGIVEHFAAQGHHCKPNYNPADFAMMKLQTLTDADIAPLVAAVPEQDYGKHSTKVVSNTTRSAGFGIQVAYLLRRELYQFIRDKMTLGARFGMSVLLALMMGVVFFDSGNKWGNRDGTETHKEVNNHWGALVFFAINAMFLAAQPLLLVFPQERAVFMREYVSGSYGTVAYFIAKTFVEIPATFLQQLVSVCVAYFMVDMQGDFIVLVLVLTLLSVVSASTALLLGASTTRAETAVNLVPAIFVPQIMFAGFFITSEAIPVFMRWIQWICPLKYSVALVSIIEFSNDNVPSVARSETALLINNSNINRDDWWIYTIILLGMFVVLRVISSIILARRAKSFE